MKLWLDDIRKPPFGWEWVKTYDECTRFLRCFVEGLLPNIELEAVSLDHDLAEEHYNDSVGYFDAPIPRSSYKEKTGYDVLLWMAEHNLWPKTIVIHTLNPSGRLDMQAFARKHAPEDTQVIVKPALNYLTVEIWP